MADTADKPTLVFLMGPTASGKTELSLLLAQQLGADIISVDSTLVYKGLDIGSAKPSVAERHGIPHHLIDIRDPSEVYSAADFRRDAVDLIERLVANGRTPLLVGGTMLYFKVLLEGLADLPPADPAVRAEIETEAKTRGWPAMHRQLQAIDPVSAKRLHPNHSQRITRALEVYRLTGQTLSELQRQEPDMDLLSKYRVVQLALLPKDRSLLHARIEKRFCNMLAQGFEGEVRNLFERGDLNPTLPAIRAVGYRQMWGYLGGEYNLETCVERGVAATRQLAKRQLTWLRSWRDLHPLYCDDVLLSPQQGQQRKFTEIRDRALNYIDPTTI